MSVANETKIRLRISIVQAVVSLTIAVFSSAGDQVSSFTHSDPRFAGLRLPQTPPILNTDVYYLQLVSLYTGTHAKTHMHAHTQAFAFECALMFSLVVLYVCVSVYVCELRTMDGLTMKYLRKSCT